VLHIAVALEHIKVLSHTLLGNPKRLGKVIGADTTTRSKEVDNLFAGSPERTCKACRH
jgi:hypothetical protein